MRLGANGSRAQRSSTATKDAKIHYTLNGDAPACDSNTAVDSGGEVAIGLNETTVKAIAWLMVQIWFGNTYLSFAQAESFHPVFGPLLMTCFAALSNTLLLTSTCHSRFCYPAH